jgi:hypothetical protein
MKRVLLAKEWVGIRPYVWLLTVLIAIELVTIATASLFDLHRRHTMYADYQWTSEAVGWLLLSFALGSGLLVRELEDGTLDFLDGLPLRRRDVVLAKLAVAGGCLVGFALVEPVLAWLLHLLLRHSVDEPVGFATLAALCLRYALAVAAGLGLGLLFGFVRHLSWVLLAMAAAGLMLLRTLWPHAAAIIDPTAPMADGWTAHGIDGSAVLGVAALAAGCMALAGLLFAHAGGAGMLRLARLARRRAFQFTVYPAGIAAVIAAAVVLAKSDSPQDGEVQSGNGGTAVVVSAAPAGGPARKVVTAHYTFNVPAGVAIGERELRAADNAFAIASRALAAPEPPDAPRIDVDMGGSVSHTRGIAQHGRIRIDVHPGWENTLVHETVHVLLAWAAGPAHAGELDKMSLLNEGTARWAEPVRRATPDHPAEDLAVAATFRRGLLSRGVLLDSGALDRDFDPSMKYPLGARLAEAMVARYGQDAPLRVVRALAREDFPRDQSGYGLYRTAFQFAGYDLNLVLNDYALALRSLAATHAAAIDAMPRPRGLLLRDGDRVGIAVQTEKPLAQDAFVAVRFRPREDSPVNEQTEVTNLERRGGRRVAWLPLAKVAHDRVCYQIGIGMGTRMSGPVLVEPWSCLPLRVALRVH